VAIQNDGEEPTVPHVPPAAVPQFVTRGNQAQHAWRLWFNDPRHRALAAGLGLLLIIGCVVTVGILHVATSRPDGYLATDDRGVAFIQFTDDQSGHLNGSWQAVSVAADETLSSVSAALTGVQNGSQVSLTYSLMGLSVTLDGTLSGDTLTLRTPDQSGSIVPLVFHAASVSDYNTAVARLRQRTAAFAAATQAAQATATTQAALDQAVTSANSQLSSDLRALNSDVQGLAGSSDFSNTLNYYAKDWAQMQTDYQKEQNDYQQGCGMNGYNASVVAYDASTVSYDLSSIQYDDSSLSYDQSGMSGPLGHVQSDIKTVQSDWSTLQAAITADRTSFVTAQLTADDINTATAKAQKQVDTSNNALQSAQAQAQQYDKEAAQTNTDAQNLANSMHC
jgi:hypothetical protein